MSKTFTEDEMKQLVAQSIMIDRQIAFMRWALNAAAQAKIPEEVYNAGLMTFQNMTAQTQRPAEEPVEEE